MKLQKGATLIEIIISLTILVIITGMYAHSVTQQLRMLEDSRSITENVFATTVEVESQAQDIRRYLDDQTSPYVSPPFIPTETVFAGTPHVRTIEFHPIEEVIINRDGTPSTRAIHTVVASKQPPKFDVPAITGMDTNFLIGGATHETVYAAQAPKVEINIPSSNIYRPDLLLMTRFQWYMSAPGFLARWDHADEEDPDVGNLLPSFPRDFMIIPGATTRELTITPEMAGRHIVGVATPAAHSGRMGQRVPGKPRLVFGLPVLSDSGAFQLLSHFDANLIDLPVDDPGSNRERNPTGNIVANAWPDMFGSHDGVVVGTKPVLRRSATFLPDGRRVPFQAVSFNGATNIPAPVPVHPSEGFTMFAVVSVNSLSQSLIASGNGIAFNAAEFGVSVANPDGDERNNLHILGFAFDPSSNQATRTVGANPAAPLPDDTFTLHPPSPFAIGTNSNIDLLELIIYRGVLPDERWRQVTMHLGEKYLLD